MSEEEILEKISQLEGITSQLKERIQELFPGSEYSKFENNLYFGMRGNEVKKLQQFLSEQGEEIYPEKLVTGNFLSLTRQAVIRFQEKYADEILTPLGLTEGTGYFGPSTRKKINKLLGY
jgi:peptidoglycan hydrolase-like protein with peptidoglycan-binding domain